MFPIKYIDNNLVWNKDNEVFAYYELIPYNYSFLSPEQKYVTDCNGKFNPKHTGTVKEAGNWKAP